MAHSTVPIDAADPRYPPDLMVLLGGQAPRSINALGNPDILREKPLALFCSRRCPGSLILQTYDLACALRDAGVTVVGGFHSPMEQECLRLLLRGEQPVIVCLARGMMKRLPAEWRKPIEDGRLLIVSPFDEKVRRVTAETAEFRNRFVAALADKVFIAYAALGSQTEAFAREIVAWRKPLLTFDTPQNAGLLELGAQPLRANDVAALRAQGT